MHGVQAAHAVGMRCIAIPSIPQPLDLGFATADLLVAGGDVNVKAKTCERLGFAGRGEGIVAEAVVLISHGS